jgi:hypothetical protein
VLHGSCTRPSSSSDLQLEIYRAAAKNDRKALAAAVQDNIERYGSDTGPDDPLQKLQGFLPLLPALSDPKSPKYTEALEYFSGSDRWSILRWMWVRRFELPQEDAITFLGGRENEPFLGFLVQLLLNDQEAMEKMVRAYFGNPILRSAVPSSFVIFTRSTPRRSRRFLIRICVPRKPRRSARKSPSGCGEAGALWALGEFAVLVVGFGCWSGLLGAALYRRDVLPL